MVVLQLARKPSRRQLRASGRTPHHPAVARPRRHPPLLDILQPTTDDAWSRFLRLRREEYCSYDDGDVAGDRANSMDAIWSGGMPVVRYTLVGHRPRFPPTGWQAGQRRGEPGRCTKVFVQTARCRQPQGHDARGEKGARSSSSSSVTSGSSSHQGPVQSAACTPYTLAALDGSAPSVN